MTQHLVYLTLIGAWNASTKCDFTKTQKDIFGGKTQTHVKILKLRMLYCRHSALGALIFILAMCFCLVLKIPIINSSFKFLSTGNLHERKFDFPSLIKCLRKTACREWGSSVSDRMPIVALAHPNNHAHWGAMNLICFIWSMFKQKKSSQLTRAEKKATWLIRWRACYHSNLAASSTNWFSGIF